MKIMFDVKQLLKYRQIRFLKILLDLNFYQ
jgi:hypothetical protein